MVIDKCYELNHTYVELLWAEQDMALGVQFLYGGDVEWPLPTSHFMHKKLIPELRILHIIVETNIQKASDALLIYFNYFCSYSVDNVIFFVFGWVSIRIFRIFISYFSTVYQVCITILILKK